MEKRYPANRVKFLWPWRSAGVTGYWKLIADTTESFSAKWEGCSYVVF